MQGRYELKFVVDGPTKQEAAAKQWYQEHNLPYKNENARKNDPEDMKPPRHVGLSPEEKGIKKVREQDVWIWARRLERYKPMAQAVYNGQDDWKNSRKLRPAKKINQKWRPANFILAGGALAAKQDAVGPGVLSGTGLAVNKDADDRFLLPSQLSGRRLALAKWIASDENPLTARSIANRVWQYHFGRGIVRTPNNFGAKGSKPTHPELLDWLTADFIEHGWKIKRVHRLIIRSAVYQQGTAFSDDKADIDPANRFLWRMVPQRLEGIDQDPVVPGMQADGGFIQNIADPGQVRSELGGQTDALGFAARKRIPTTGQ